MTLPRPPRDAPALKTGKAAPTLDVRDALFTEFATVAKLPRIPTQFGNEDVIDSNKWGMLGNGPDDSVAPGFGGAGNCVFAGAAHETMLWRRVSAKRAVRFTGAEAIQDYGKVTGYVLGDPRTDNGTVVREALRYRQKTGVLDHAGSRHKIGAYLQLEPGNEAHVKAATYLFDAVGVGFAFPVSADSQFAQGKPWTVVAGAGIDGGHYVPVIGVRPSGLVVVTWGRLQLMTWPFFRRYVDEAWAILSPEMLKSSRSPEGFDLGALNAYLAAL
jgi:hypothetical protein